MKNMIKPMISNLKTTRLFLKSLFIILVLMASFLVVTEYTLADEGALDNANLNNSSDDADVSCEGNDGLNVINDNVDIPLDEMD